MTNKGKIATGTGVSGVLIALFLNFGIISDELQEWWYMAKGEDRTPAPLENVSEDRLKDNPDYFIEQSIPKERIASMK